MFAPLADALQSLGYSRFDVFNFHPLQLASYLEQLWELRRNAPPPQIIQNIDPVPFPDPGVNQRVRDALGQSLDPGVPSVLQSAPGKVDSNLFKSAVALVLQNSFGTTPTGGFYPPTYWHHLAYAYLIENTRIFDVFERVVFEALTGERLGTLDEASHRWVRTTEDLFFKDTSPLMSTISSRLRLNPGDTRCNAYLRFFNMELNTPPGTTPRAYPRPDAVNTMFVPTFEQFLTEVWRGYVNAKNTSGPNTTDTSAIATLATRLQQMLRDRRQVGNLSREEFVAVATMSWFDLTLSGDTSPIIVSLKATAASPDERLRRVAEKVGLTAHSKARSLFEISWRMSALLIQIERGAYNNPANVPVLYTPTPGNAIAADMVELIIHYSIARNKDMKSVPINVGVPTINITAPATMPTA